MTAAMARAGSLGKKLTNKALAREARRLLPVLAKKGAIARCDTVSTARGRIAPSPGSGHSGQNPEVWIVLRPEQKKPSARCDRQVLDQFGQNDWVRRSDSGHWTITAAGRAWLVRVHGGEDGHRLQHQMIVERTVAMPDGSLRPVRVNEGENPLGWLRRRKGPDGNPFLSDDMVAAGDRLRSDFTLARMTRG